MEGLRAAIAAKRRKLDAPAAAAPAAAAAAAAPAPAAGAEGGAAGGAGGASEAAPRVPPATEAQEIDSDDERNALSRARDWGAPVRRECVLGGARVAPVSALALDPRGNRLASGATDGCVEMYDFGGMTASLRPFRTLEGCAEQRVADLSWSCTGDNLLVCPAAPRAKLLDRDGRTLGETSRGDMYILDLTKTVGHVAAINACAFSPVERATYATASEDGTVRVWDASDFLQNKTLLRPRQRTPQGRLPVTAIEWDRGSGSCIYGGCADGSVQMWDLRSASAIMASTTAAPKEQVAIKITAKCVPRPKEYHAGVQRAGGGENRAMCVRLAPDGRALAVRREDSVEVWDVRNLGAGPISSRDGLPTAYDVGDVGFSPDGELLAVGVAREGAGAGGSGSLHFLRAGNLEDILGVPVEGEGGGMPTRLAWHAGINQLAVCTGARGAGSVRVLYDEDLSERGASLCARARKRRPDAFVGEVGPGQIYAPGAGEKYTNPKKKASEASLRPDAGALTAGPILGSRGRGGRVGLPEHAILKQHVLKAGGHTRGELGGDVSDIREAFTRHAKDVDGKGAVGAAYAKTQPKKVFSSWEDEDSD